MQWADRAKRSHTSPDIARARLLGGDVEGLSPIRRSGTLLQAVVPGIMGRPVRAEVERVVSVVGVLSDCWLRWSDVE